MHASQEKIKGRSFAQLRPSNVIEHGLSFLAVDSRFRGNDVYEGLGARSPRANKLGISHQEAG
jgi:hypothetical protein